MDAFKMHMKIDFSSERQNQQQLFSEENGIEFAINEKPKTKNTFRTF